MTTEVALIDEIVSRVLRELRVAEAAAPSTAAPVPAEKTTTPANVSIGASVITGELLEKSIGGAKQVRVAPKAILTPSARDVIRQRGLQVVRDAGASEKRLSSGWRLIISSAGPQVDSALEGLRSGGFEFDRQLSGTTEESVSVAVSALSRGEVQGIVLLTDAPDLAACLANRSDRVRAVALRDVAALDDIRRQFQPNLVAISPSNRNSFELRQWLKGAMTP